MKNRLGSYKSIQLDLGALQLARPQIEFSISELLKSYKAGLLSDQDFTTLYLLLLLRIKHPKNYLQIFSKSKCIVKNKSLFDLLPASIELSEEEKIKYQSMDGLHLFLSCHLKSIPSSINRAMINWYNGNWNIVLSFKIPSSKNLLKLQAENKRVLTLIVEKEKLSTHILGKRDALSFALHDLMHADQFFNNNISLKGQLGFYRFIYKNYEHSELSQLLAMDKNFHQEFEYVVSDMNAYIIHLLKSFKSCFSRANREDLLVNFLTDSSIPDNIIKLIMLLNNHIISPEEEMILKDFFENYT